MPLDDILKQELILRVIKKLIATTLITALPFSVALAGSTLDRVVEKKLLVVATDANWAPQSFLNDNNEMDGFDVNIAQEVASRLGVDIKFVTPDWAILTAGNWHGRWDLSVGSMAPTAARATVLSFPAIYYYTPASFAVHKDSKAKTYADLNGTKIGVTISSSHELYMNEDLTIDALNVPSFKYHVNTDKIGSYQSTNIALDDLRLGDGVRLTSVLTNLITINEAIKNNYPIKALGEPVFYEPLALAIEKGDEEFNDTLKNIITEMREEGVLSALSEKWYGYDYTVVQ